jgi:hypothetical protein
VVAVCAQIIDAFEERQNMDDPLAYMPDPPLEPWEQELRDLYYFGADDE